MADLVRAGAIPTPADVGALGARLRENLGALAFGVEPARAREILIENDLQRAMTTGDGESLKHTIKSAAGAIDLAEHLIEQLLPAWALNETGNIFRAAAALDAADFLDPATIHGRHTIRRLVDTACALPSVQIGQGVTSGMVTLARRSGDATVRSRIFGVFARSAPSPTTDSGVDQSHSHAAIEEWAVAGVRLAESMQALEADSGNYELRIPGEVEVYVDTMAVLHTTLERDSFSALVLPEANELQIAEYFGARVGEETVNEDMERAIEYLLRANIDIDWPTFLMQLRTQLEAGKPLPDSMLTSSVKIVWSLTEKLSLGSSAEDGGVSADTWAYHFASLPGESDAAAYLAAAILEVNPAASYEGATPQTRKAYAQLRQLLRSPPTTDVLEHYASALAETDAANETLWNVYEADAETSPWVEKMLAIYAERVQLEFFRPAEVVQYYAIYSAAVPPPSLFALVNADALSEAVRSGEFFLEDADLYGELISRVSNKAELATWCARGLRAVADDEWVEEMTANGPALGLATSCMAVSVTPALEEPARLAIRTRLNQLAGGAASTEGERERLRSLIAMMAPAQGADVPQIAYDVISENSSSISEPFFEMVGDLPGLAEIFAKDRNVRRVIEAAASTRHIPTLSWIASVLSELKSPLKSLSSTERGVLRGILEYQVKSGGGDEAHALLMQIGKHYRIKTPPANAEEST